MPWWQLTVHCDIQELENTEQILQQLGAQSLTIADAGNEPLYEPLPGETPLWSNSTITGLFDQTSTLETLYDELVNQLPEHQVSSIQKHQLDDQQWERAFLDQFEPVKFGHKLWICPSWIEPPEPDGCNIILDPGIAFGTGSHPTTALCLEFLDQHPPLEQSVLDFGCGSGILAIAAFKLGAAKVSCIDIDPQAVKATADNAGRNDINPKDLNISLPNIQTIRPVEYLIANILSGPLIELEEQFASLTVPGARLLLSGILSNQVDGITQAYQRHFELDAVRMKENWCCVSGIRKDQ